MIDPITEQRVLDRAIAEGLVTLEELEDQARELALWGPRLSLVVLTGLIGPLVVKRFLAEVTEQEPGTCEVVATQKLAQSAAAEHRFELGELLGEGGMAKVYRAYDSALQRPVALKFLKSDDPDRLQRFLREAQAQARVVHENVCKIYEVGELDGRPFIAMQQIEGQPLFVTEGEVSGPSPMLLQMAVEQKARLMQRVAEGIHAAHREGLIHRDIKPSNIMLEATEDGDFKPYVLDFGLAREVASAGVTSMGLAAGTPNFMAPEQARGEAGALDRRTDVYGLGATLYALLASKPPFEGPSSLDVLVKVTEQDAPPLTAVPEDLATIVTKCLEKEPAQRYDSARAVAEDLGRYLGGDPIQAHKTSLAYRLMKRARKHKKMVVAGALASAAFMVVITWSIAAQLRAQQRARLAGVFGQEVRVIESQLRIAHLLPEHDIRPEKAAIRRRMNAIQAQIQTIGGVAEGPGHYALGRGHLALKEYDQARNDLDRAWSAGYRERECAFALGQTMGAQYQRELQAVTRISDKKRREQAITRAEHEYRDPALAYLRQSRGVDLESPEYGEALIAFYEKRYDETLEKARAASARAPWLYEAKDLEARVYMVMGADEFNHGRYDAARGLFGRAEDAYRAGLAVGQSDSMLADGMCRVPLAIMRMDMWGRGGNLQPYLEKGLAMCERAIRVDPEEPDAYQAKSALLMRVTEQTFNHGDDTRGLIDTAIEASRQALRLSPNDIAAYLSLAFIFRNRGLLERGRGLSPEGSLRECIGALEKAAQIDPAESDTYHLQGMCYSELAFYEELHGKDPRPSLRRTQQLYERAATLKPDYQPGNLSAAYRELAAWEVDHGQDPRATLAKAFETAQKATAIDPSSCINRARPGSLYKIEADYELAIGDDPRMTIEKMVESTQAALTINPKFVPAFERMAYAFLVRARLAFEKGENPQPAIDEGRTWNRKVVENDKNHVTSYLQEAQFSTLEVRRRLRQGLDPDEALSSAQRALDKALRINTEDPDVYVSIAETRRWQADWHRRQGKDVGKELALGLDMTDKALAINPTHARALAMRGALYLDQAHDDTRHRNALLAKARESLEKAISVNRFLGREFQPLLDQCS